MTELKFNATAIVRTLEGEAHWGEVLLFPEASTLGVSRDKILEALQRHVRDLTSADPALTVHHRRRSVDLARIVDVSLKISPPPRRSGVSDDVPPDHADASPLYEAWREPVDLTLRAIAWAHGGFAHVAFVPALGIEVVADTESRLAEMLLRHVRFALARTGAAMSLRKLTHLQRGDEDVALEPLQITAAVKTPKQLAVEAGEEEPQKPAIDEVGVVLSNQSLSPAYEVDAVVARLAETLSGRHPRSVLLVGRSGVGKTAALRELVRRRSQFDLNLSPFWSTTGSRLVAGMSGFGMWQQRCQRLVSEASKARAVIDLGNLMELMEVGRSPHNAQGIASFLRPYLSRGEILAICECTPEQLQLVERADPHLLEVFHQIRVEEPSPETVDRILGAVVRAQQSRDEPNPLTDEAFAAIGQMHRRYATYSASPARPLRFVLNLLRDRGAAAFKSAGEYWTPTAPPLGRREVIAAFARETGLPLFLLDESVLLDLAAARKWFASRLIGQGGAIDGVVDLLATVKAAMNRPGKPIASLLFIGPTGVGKTELAKLLAEFFFGDRGRLTRFDMSEYATPDAVERLVGGGVFGNAGAGERGEGLLTAKVREQPFGVVLLDEFEKAHPALFDLMLQVLGEGRLTDASGRVADFSNSFVIMTSNLGAQSFQQAPFGFAKPAADGGATRGDTATHFLEAVRGFFRPELFNRIDRVVPFAPLTAEQVLEIARRELDLIRRRDGVMLRGMELVVSEEAVRQLARRGFDAAYGARPLKRAIERELLAPLADAVNDYAEEVKLVADVRTDPAGDDDNAALRVNVRAAVGAAGQSVSAAPSAAPLAGVAADASWLRRNIQRLQRGAAIMSLRNELFELHRLHDSIASRRRALHALNGRDPGKAAMKRLIIRPEEEIRLLRLDRVNPVAKTLDDLTARAIDLEDRALAGVYDADPADAESAATLDPEVKRARADWPRLLHAIYALRFDDPNRVLLAVYGDKPEAMFRLAAAYRALAFAKSAQVTVHQLLRPGSAQHDRPIFDKPEIFFEDRPGATTGIALVIAGTDVLPLFELERGLHVLARDRQPIARCIVDVAAQSINAYEVRGGLALQEAFTVLGQRRTYHLDQSFAVEPDADARLRWTGRQWEQVIGPAMDEQLGREVRSAVLGDDE